MTTDRSQSPALPPSASSWLAMALGCCTAPVLAGLLVHQRLQQWLTVESDYSSSTWQDRRLPEIARPLSARVKRATQIDEQQVSAATNEFPTRASGAAIEGQPEQPQAEAEPASLG
ncbi:MAG: hypothetical protein AAGB13_05350 [Cyanobacteria bacterium P01_F01_bin.33]